MMDEHPAKPADDSSHFVFPKWLDALRPPLTIVGAIAPLYIIAMFAWGASPTTINVGYMPDQPVPYSHQIHVGKLGIDCLYCHNTVTESGHAAIPPTQTCMNCHQGISVKDSKNLAPVKESAASGMPIEWVRVHDLPDYVYFDHSAHVRRGVGCVSCHGRIDQMEKVYQAEPLSMSWCLECHRNPEQHLRPLDQITNMTYQAEDQEAEGARLRELNNIHPSTNCSTCHR